LFLKFYPSLAVAYQSSEINEQHEYNTFIYSEQTDSFKKIPQTIDAVDSLLTVSSDYLEKDSGISFQTARNAEIIAEAIKYKGGMSDAYNLLGNHYLDFGNHETANIYYLKALRIEEELGDDRGIAHLLNNLSLIYVEQEQYNTAAEYLEKSLNTWERLDEERQTLISINNLGVIHRRQGNYEKALDYFWEISKRSILTDNPDSLSYIIASINIGNTYRNMGNYSRAKIHLDTALEYLNRHAMTSHLIFTNIVMGRLYNDTGQVEKAIAHTEKGLSLAQSEQMRENIKEAHELLASIYEGIEEYELAYYHFRLFHQHSDTLQTMQSGTKISELQRQFDVEQKDREIEILSQEAELREANLLKMNRMRSFLIAGVVILFIVIALLYRSNRTRKLNNQNLEKQRRQIEENNMKLSKLNAEKDEFLSIAAHDLRNPLSSINLAVDMINSEENTDKSTIREYTDMIKISSNRMITLINDVLKIHTIGSHTPKDSSTFVEINPLIDESLQHFNEPARSKNIRIRTVLNRSNDPVVGDSDNILRILDNLISNAIKYSPKHSSVIISTKQTGENIQISVRDQGPGISDSDKRKLFKKFSKLDSKPTGNESSTGLGLYIVKKICDSMGGSVRCESEPGCGATFIVDLPAAASESSSIDRSIKKKRVALG
jgi:signal transduction histidine kinase/Tfp pilus assembly protein PilF